MSSMFGVIMAGGQGTRLYPLTANRPKPMVEVIGRPVIEYVKDAMLDAGVSEIIVTTGYKGDMLEELVDHWSSNDSRLEKSLVNQESVPMGQQEASGFFLTNCKILSLLVQVILFFHVTSRSW